MVVDARPDIYAHNVETVPAMYNIIRPEADYYQSIELLGTVKKGNRDMLTKSGMMLGLGESLDDIIEVLRDLRSVDCDYITLGQYLAPSSDHYPVRKYITPGQFSALGGAITQ